MRSVHPGYVVLLFVVGFVFMGWKLHEVKNAYGHAAVTLQETKAMARQTVALNKTWGQKQADLQTLETMAKGPLFVGVNVTMQMRGRLWSVTVERANKKAAEYLLGRLLNAPYVIKALSLKRIDATHASLHVEVAL